MRRGLVRDHLGVADHEAGDRRERSRQAEPFEPPQEVGHGRGGGQDDARRHAERALDQDVPHRPEPLDGQRQTQHLDALALPDERQEQGEQHERQLDHEPLRDEAERQAGELRRARRASPRRRRTPRTPPAAWPRRRRRTARAPATLHSGGSRWTGPSPWTNSECACPPLTSPTPDDIVAEDPPAVVRRSLRRRLKTGEDQQTDAERDRDARRCPASPVDSPSSSTPLHAVAGERAVGGCVARLAVGEALVDRDLVRGRRASCSHIGLTKKARPSATSRPPTISASACPFDRPRHHDLPATSEPSRTSSAGTQVLGAVDEVGAHAEHDADRERGDDALADADQAVHADHRREDRRHGGATVAAHRVLDDEAEGSQHDREQGGDPGCGDGRRPRGGQHAADARRRARSRPTGDQRHVEDVEAEGRQPAVGEQQRLDEQDDGDRHGARPRPDQDRRRDTPRAGGRWCRRRRGSSASGPRR